MEAPPLGVVVPPKSRDPINVLCDGLQNTTLLSSDADFAVTYDVGKELGHGGWARVYAVEKRGAQQPGPPLAAKVLDKEALTRQVGDVKRIVARMRAECRVLSELRHPRVIQLEEIFESPQHLFIVMERAAGGALLDRIIARGYFTEPDARAVMRQLIDVLAFMHGHGVIHRDIKPENILLDAAPGGGATGHENFDIKVTDFGLVKIFSDQEDLGNSFHRKQDKAAILSSRSNSRVASGVFGSLTSLSLRDGIERCHTRVGSPFYRAPEQVFCYPPYPTTYGPEVDVWSAGWSSMCCWRAPIPLRTAIYHHPLSRPRPRPCLHRCRRYSLSSLRSPPPGQRAVWGPAHST